mgnify:CR=1 FL=1
MLCVKQPLFFVFNLKSPVFTCLILFCLLKEKQQLTCPCCVWPTKQGSKAVSMVIDTSVNIGKRYTILFFITQQTNKHILLAKKSLSPPKFQISCMGYKVPFWQFFRNWLIGHALLVQPSKRGGTESFPLPFLPFSALKLSFYNLSWNFETFPTFFSVVKPFPQF